MLDRTWAETPNMNSFFKTTYTPQSVHSYGLTVTHLSVNHDPGKQN